MAIKLITDLPVRIDKRSLRKGYDPNAIPPLDRTKEIPKLYLP
jgi:hypothetical protein